MNLLLVALSVLSLVGVAPTGGAPAVTSVHVSFVSGNKKTQYSHGTHTRPAVVQYNLDAAGTGDDLLHRRLRSISEHHQQRRTRPHYNDNSGPVEQTTTTSKSARRIKFRRPVSGAILLVSPKIDTIDLMKKNPSTAPTIITSSTIQHISTTSPTSTNTITTNKTKRRYMGHASPLTFAPLSTTTTIQTRGDNPAITLTPTTTTRLRRLRSRVRFVEVSPTSSQGKSVSSSSTPTFLLSSTLSSDTATSATVRAPDDTTNTADNTNNSADSTKPKDTKAVKRSPYIENFESRGITFPDFDEFGGNEFGALRNLIGSGGGGGGSLAAHTHANPESLSPDGVFLPPLPTEATDYTEDGHGHSDPYVADPETAKYAAQHPPFFAAFPHKRTVLDLNERRVEQGLEPNILRSIRPYFAFFEAAK